MKKIGRNAPCPCGSGKKFKHCHLGREDELVLDGRGDISMEMSSAITALPQVTYGRSGKMIEALDLMDLTGCSVGIRCVDLGRYRELGMTGRPGTQGAKTGGGAVVINVLKTRKSDPDNIYLAISPRVSDSILVHQLAHVLDYLKGSGLIPGITRALSFDLGVPPEHLEHPHEFGTWLSFLHDRFHVRPDADDAIIAYLHQHGMLIMGKDIRMQDRIILKSKSEQILDFLGKRSEEIDVMIRELPGYIGSRVGRD